MSYPAERRILMGLGLIGPVFLGLALLSLWQAHRIASWPVITARVAKSAVESRQDMDRHWSHQPRVEYRYQVGGKDYASDRLGATTWASGGKAEVEAFLKAYPVGGAIHIRYDPASPESAVVDGQSSVLPYVFLAAGAIVTVTWVLVWRALAPAQR